VQVGQIRRWLLQSFFDDMKSKINFYPVLHWTNPADIPRIDGA